MERKRKIALVGGGTAGHITPNIALISELKNRKYDVIYIGSSTGMEKDIMERLNIPFFGITTDKLRRYFDLKNLMMPFNVLKGINEAKNILKEEKPDIIFSKGGYVAVPVVIAAGNLKIPVISHEADITPGLANKIAMPFSKVICCNFEEAAKSFGKKGIETGSPIRKEILTGDKKKAKDLLKFKEEKPIIFVTGGSLGSVYINNLIRKNIDKLLVDYNIIHQCGKGKLDESLGGIRIQKSCNSDKEEKNCTEPSYTNEEKGYRQFETISEELADIFAVSDFVISRAGANIIFELLTLKKPMLLIPLSKKASRGDQILNARSFEKKGYAIVLTEEEEDKTPSLFFEKIETLKVNSKQIIQKMSEAKESNAIKIICDIIDKY